MPMERANGKVVEDSLQAFAIAFVQPKQTNKNHFFRLFRCSDDHFC